MLALDVNGFTTSTGGAVTRVRPTTTGQVRVNAQNYEQTAKRIPEHEHITENRDTTGNSTRAHACETVRIGEQNTDEE